MDSIKAALALLEGRTDQRQAEIDVSTLRAAIARMARKVLETASELSEGPGRWKSITQQLESDITKIQTVYAKAFNHLQEFSGPDASEEWPVRSEIEAAEAVERARQLADDLAEDVKQLQSLIGLSDELLAITSSLFELQHLNKKLPADSELLKK